MRGYLGPRAEISIPYVVGCCWSGWCGAEEERAMELTAPVKALLREAAQALTGSERRRFLARTVEELGPGGQRRSARELGWSRVTIRKGQRERTSGFACVDGFALRGRKRAEAHLPDLLADLEAIVASQSQADPSFHTTRLYTRLTAGEVRRRQIA